MNIEFVLSHLLAAVIGMACTLLATNGGKGWKRQPRTDRDDKPDCDGPSPCSTCQDKRECGRTGCVRQREHSRSTSAVPAGVQDQVKGNA